MFMIKTTFLEIEYPIVQGQENLCLGPQSYIGATFRVQIRNKHAQKPQR